MRMTMPKKIETIGISTSPTTGPSPEGKGSSSLRRLHPAGAVPEQPRTIILRLVRRFALPGLVAGVEAGPDVVPVSAGGGLGVFGRARFEGVGVLDGDAQRGEPGERVVFGQVARLEAEPSEAPEGDVAHGAVERLGGRAWDWALLEREVDEGVLQPHRLLAHVEDVFLDRRGQAAAFLAEGVEQASDACAVQALVADRPREELAHAL